MREIKFRALHKPTGKMRSVRSIVFFRNGMRIIFSGEDCPSVASEEWVELMQYTGRRDKNSKEIYHQDILRIKDDYDGDHFEEGGNFIVEWVDDGWAVVDKDSEFLCSLSNAVYNRGAKIVGNIHENPELLERA